MRDTDCRKVNEVTINIDPQDLRKSYAFSAFLWCVVGFVRYARSLFLGRFCLFFFALPPPPPPPPPPTKMRKS
jgi:hypothetical protein